MPEFTLSELATTLDCEMQGNGDTIITSLGTVENAKAGQICFIANKQYSKHLASTSASAAIVSPQLLEQCSVPALVTKDPYGAYAKLSILFDDAPSVNAGISPQAVVSAGAIIAASASVAAMAVIEAGAEIGEGAVIGVGCYIGADVIVGSNTKLYPNAVSYTHLTLPTSDLV